MFSWQWNIFNFYCLISRKPPRFGKITPADIVYSLLSVNMFGSHS